jgi:methylglutaconyl-CoA hydratase
MTMLLTDTDERGVITLTLNRPEQHNALNPDLINLLSDALETLADKTRVLILKGQGRSFCAGADITWMKESAALSATENKRDAAVLSLMLDRLNTFPCPTIACVHGAALGGGVGLASCCDITIADHETVFALSEVRLGLIPATISPYVLAAIGGRAARRYFLTAERFDAELARHIGLVHEVCQSNQLEAQLEKLLNHLLAGAPQAQRESKQLISSVSGQPVNDSLRLDLSDRLARIRSGSEAQEVLAAFLNKRKPDW